MSTNKEPFALSNGWAILFAVMVLLAAASLFACSGCYTPKKATRQVLKAQTYHPEVVAKACADLFPIKETTVTKIVTKEGKTDTLHNYVLVDCDSIVKSEPAKLRAPIRIPCPPSLTRVDTVEKDRLVIQENTARVSQLTTEKQNERDARIKAEGKASIWFWAFICIAAYQVVRIVLSKLFRINFLP